MVTIYFYTTIGEYGFLSNFSRHGFGLDGKYWPTVEHYFQAMKFVGTQYEERVRPARTAKEAKRLGRNRSWPLRSDWEEVKVALMKGAVLRKFETHQDIRQRLLATDELELVENAPSDYFWGCGADGSGQNMLGKILMEVRDLLGEGREPYKF